MTATPLHENPRFRLLNYLTIENPVMSCKKAIPMVNSMSIEEVEAELKVQEEKHQIAQAHGRLNAGLQVSIF